MTARWHVLLCAALGSAGLVLALGQFAATAFAAASAPDFSGVWRHGSIPGFEPLSSGPTSLVNLKRRGITSDNRQLMGDYNNPILKPEAAATVKRLGEEALRTGVTFLSPRNQCWPEGPPYIFYNLAMQMIQERDRVIIMYSNDREVRYVRMNQSHPANPTPTWFGDSVGHYEGDTLVVDTVAIKMGRFSMADWYGTPRTAATHVVERYRLLDYKDAKEGLERDAKENYQTGAGPGPDNVTAKYLQLYFTVEDPGVFTTPWSATITYRPSRPNQDAFGESICAESPFRYGTEPDPILPVATKADF